MGLRLMFFPLGGRVFEMLRSPARRPNAGGAVPGRTLLAAASLRTGRPSQPLLARRRIDRFGHYRFNQRAARDDALPQAA